jgi:acyl dehydratase
MGDKREVGTRTITKQEIVDFARQFDPQSFHVDEEAARSGPFGQLVASGWHTASLCMRMLVDGLIRETATLGSPGVDELRWLKPVVPGDRLTLHAEVVDVRPSRSKPDRGSITLAYTLYNQAGDRVLTMKGLGILKRRV